MKNILSLITSLIALCASYEAGRRQLVTTDLPARIIAPLERALAYSSGSRESAAATGGRDESTDAGIAFARWIATYEAVAQAARCELREAIADLCRRLDELQRSARFDGEMQDHGTPPPPGSQLPVPTEGKDRGASR